MTDKVAVVTGAAKGIGLGIAKKFCEAGYKTIMLGRNGACRTQAKLLCDSGFLAYDFSCDITSAGDADRMVSEFFPDDFCGEITLVNNAGVARIAAFEETDEELLDFHINTNLKGTWNVTRAVVPVMKKNKFGRIINISSVTGPFVCDRGYAAYAMTKAGLIGLTKALAVEYAQYKITANAICPGFIRTPNVERSARTTNPDNPELVLDKIAAGVPLKRLGTPEEIGALAVFLAGSDASYITGAACVIDGGNMLPETNVMGL